MMMCTRWEPCSEPSATIFCARTLYFSDSPRISFWPSLNQAFLEKCTTPFVDVVIDGVRAALRKFSGLCDPLLEGGRFAVDDGLGQSFLGKRDLRLIGGELSLLHGNLYIAAENPATVLEIQPRGLRLIGGDRHVALRDAHLAKYQIVVLVVEFGGLRIERDRLLLHMGGGHRVPRRQCEREQSNGVEAASGFKGGNGH